MMGMCFPSAGIGQCSEYGMLIDGEYGVADSQLSVSSIEYATRPASASRKSEFVTLFNT